MYNCRCCFQTFFATKRNYLKVDINTELASHVNEVNSSHLMKMNHSSLMPEGIRPECSCSIKKGRKS